jgi:hypothetical protein
MEFIRSNVLRRRTSATEIIAEDLPTNPLSHLVVSIEGYNATDEATLAEIIAFLNSVTITDQGRQIVSLQSEDLYAVDTYLYRQRPVLTQMVATDNATRCLSLIVPFGRRIFDVNECYPARKRGDLKLQLDTTALATSIDNGQISVEAIEMPGATPSKYLKTITKTVSAPGATGNNDVALPIGNQIVAIQLRMTTFPTTSSHTYGVDDASILKDNTEYGYVGNVAQCLVGDGIFRMGAPGITIAAQGNLTPPNVVWLDFDPAHNDGFLLETAGASDLVARLNMGVDEATYLTTLELVAVQ